MSIPKAILFFILMTLLVMGVSFAAASVAHADNSKPVHVTAYASTGTLSYSEPIICRYPTGQPIDFKHYFALRNHRFYNPYDEYHLWGDVGELSVTVMSRVMNTVADFQDCLAIYQPPKSKE